MKIRQLYEGLIDVPEHLIDRCEYELMKFISTTIIAKSDMSEEMSKRTFHTFKKRGIEFKDYDGKYELNDGKVLGSTITYDSSDIKYNTQSDTTSHLMLGVVISKARSSVYGFYSPKQKAVVINLHQLFSGIEKELNLKLVVDELSDDLKDGWIDDSVQFIDNKILNFMKHVRGTLKHELQHYIQDVYFPSVEKDYASPNDRISYLTSDLEFNPTITSIVYYFKTLQKDKDSTISSKEYMDMFHAAVNGTAIDMPSNIDFNSYMSIIDSWEFFKTLKDHKPKKWKIAVKYLYTELKDEGIL